MTDIRDAFAKQSTSHTVDLGSKEWEINKPIKLRGRTVTGDGYTINIAPRSERYAPAIVLRGEGTRWIGHGTIQGSMPDGHGFNERQEAQHLISTNGLVDGEISGVKFRNCWGDAIYVNRDEERRWTTHLRVHDCEFDEIGRHALTANAVEGGVFARLKIGRCNLSIVDCEPDGKSAGWGCHNLQWLDSDIYDHGGGFVFANKGGGTSDSVHDILLGGIRCHNRPFSMTVNPVIPGVRRHNYWIRNCSGILVPGDRQSPLVFRHTDHVTVEDVDQPTAKGVPLVEQHDCTNVSVTP